MLIVIASFMFYLLIVIIGSAKILFLKLRLTVSGF